MTNKDVNLLYVGVPPFLSCHGIARMLPLIAPSLFAFCVIHYPLSNLITPVISHLHNHLLILTYVEGGVDILGAYY